MTADRISSVKTLLSLPTCAKGKSQKKAWKVREIKQKSRFMMSEDFFSFLTTTFLKPNGGASHLALTVCRE